MAILIDQSGDTLIDQDGNTLVDQDGGTTFNPAWAVQNVVIQPEAVVG